MPMVPCDGQFLWIKKAFRIMKFRADCHRPETQAKKNASGAAF
jgi:hypothetical protein